MAWLELHTCEQSLSWHASGDATNRSADFQFTLLVDDSLLSHSPLTLTITAAGQSLFAGLL